MSNSINDLPNQALVEAALQFASRGWHVFACEPRGKKPLTKHGFKDATVDPARIEAWWRKWPDANVGIATGASGLVVLDVDGEEGRRELAALLASLGVILPRTLSAKTGREGGIHAYYRGAVPSSQVKGEHLDVRGTTGYVIAPGSIHPNGRAYEWVDAAWPVLDVPEWVGAWVSRRRGGVGLSAPSAHVVAASPAVERPAYLGARRGVADSLIRAMCSTPYSEHAASRVRSALAAIPPDSLSDVWLPIGAALHDLNWIINERDEGFEIWNEWSSKSEGKGPAKGEYKGRADLIKRWESFNKDREGPRATIGTLFFIAKNHGWNGLAEVPHINGEATALPSQLTQSTPANPLIALNDKFAVISDLGGKCLVMGMVASKVDETLRVPSFQTFKSFTERYSHKYVTIAGESKPMGASWLKWSGRSSYEGIDLVPGAGAILPNDVLNLWTGFGVPATPGAWPLMRAHVEQVLAGGDVTSAVYIMKYAAWCVQNPGTRAEVALCFRGEKGSGKGTFANALRRIFGQHGLHVYNSKHLVGSFNGHLRNCLLLFADEAFWAGDKQGESVLKGMITEPSLMIEQKGVDAVPWRNRLHVIMAANAEWVVPAGHQERRYAVFDVSGSRVGDFEYFRALHEELNAGGLSAMLADMLRARLGDWHPRDIPQTEALRHQKELSLSALESWWEGLLQDGTLPFHMMGKPKKAWSSGIIQNVKDAIGVGRESSPQAVGRFLRRRSAEGYHGEHGNAWTFPDLSNARQQWERENHGWAWRKILADWQEYAKK